MTESERGSDPRNHAAPIKESLKSSPNFKIDAFTPSPKEERLFVVMEVFQPLLLESDGYPPYPLIDSVDAVLDLAKQLVEVSIAVGSPA